MEPSSMTHLMVLAKVPLEPALTRQMMSRLSVDSSWPFSTTATGSGSSLVAAQSRSPRLLLPFDHNAAAVPTAAINTTAATMINIRRLRRLARGRRRDWLSGAWNGGGAGACVGVIGPQSFGVQR